MAKDRDEKIANIKTMEREINEFRQTREQQLQQQAMRMREGIVKEITDIVLERVKTNGMDLSSINPGRARLCPTGFVLQGQRGFHHEIIRRSQQETASAPEKPATTAAPPDEPGQPPAKP